MVCIGTQHNYQVLVIPAGTPGLPRLPLGELHLLLVEGAAVSKKGPNGMDVGAFVAGFHVPLTCSVMST